MFISFCFWLQDVLKSCVEHLQSRIQEMMMENSGGPGPNPGGDAGAHGSSTSQQHRLDDAHSLDKLGELEQAETPTDVRDIHF